MKLCRSQDHFRKGEKKTPKPKGKNNDSKWGKIADLLETWQKQDVKEKN